MTTLVVVEKATQMGQEDLDIASNSLALLCVIQGACSACCAKQDHNWRKHLQMRTPQPLYDGMANIDSLL